MKKSDYHYIVPSAYLILRRGDEVLLMRRANSDYMNGMYSLPSGHVEKFEPADVAAIRETKEEVGVEVKKEDLTFVYMLYRKAIQGDHERACFFFETGKWQNEIKNCEPDKCDDVRWFSINNLPDNMAEEVRHVFEELKKGTLYSNFNYN